MHAIDQITPEIILVMCLGGIAFVVIFWALFRKRK